MMKPRLRLLDTEALALHHKVAPGTIRRWASEDGWHRYGTRRHRLWSMADAQASQDKRRADEGADCA
jgi:23S rRNA G2445 N2-methylase RlmL